MIGLAMARRIFLQMIFLVCYVIIAPLIKEDNMLSRC